MLFNIFSFIQTIFYLVLATFFILQDSFNSLKLHLVNWTVLNKIEEPNILSWMVRVWSMIGGKENLMQHRPCRYLDTFVSLIFVWQECIYCLLYFYLLVASEIKWVEFTFIISPLLFYTPWYISDFLMFVGVIKRERWPEISWKWW